MLRFEVIFPILQPPLGENFDNPMAFPAGMELYPFQCDGVKFLAEHGVALLGDEIGLGKSIQAIVAIRFLIRVGKITRCLILCPASLVTDWEKKFWDWVPELRIVKVRGNREQREVLWNSHGHVYVTNYEALSADLAKSFKFNAKFADIARKQFDLVVLDEIQNIKNRSSDKHKAVNVLDSSQRWGLSGTPLENSIDDLVSIFNYLRPGSFSPQDLLYIKAAWPGINRLSKFPTPANDSGDRCSNTRPYLGFCRRGRKRPATFTQHAVKAVITDAVNYKLSYFRTSRTSTAATPPPCARTMIGLISISER